jgi:hypothetical protein
MSEMDNFKPDEISEEEWELYCNILIFSDELTYLFVTRMEIRYFEGKVDEIHFIKEQLPRLSSFFDTRIEYLVVKMNEFEEFREKRVRQSEDRIIERFQTKSENTDEFIKDIQDTITNFTRYELNFV